MSTTALKRVIWKDWKQIQTPVLAIAALLCSVQIIVIAIEFLLPHFFGPIPEVHPPFLYNLTLAVPIIMAAIVAGTFIGQERGNRTWNWSSSLPIPWYFNLFSQFANWLLALVIALVPMLALASLIPLPVFYFGAFINQLVNFLLVGLELAIWLSILMLIFKDSTAGILLGFATFIAYEIFVGFSSPLVVSGSIPIDPAPDRFGHVMRFSILVGSAILAIRLFYWRWTSGLDRGFSFRRTSRKTLSAEIWPREWTIAMFPKRKPGENKMIIGHGFRCSSIGQIIISGIVITIVITLATWPIPNVNRIGLWPVIYACTSILFFFAVMPATGLMAFSSDHFDNRFRFMTDRGVRPLKFVGIRMAIALMTSTLLSFIAWIFASKFHAGKIPGIAEMPPIPNWFEIWLGALAITSLAILSGLCFRRTATAFLATAFAGGIGSILFLTTLLTWDEYVLANTQRFAGFRLDFELCSQVGYVVTIITMPGYTLIAARSWVINERFNGLRWLLSACVVAFVASTVAVIAASLWQIG